MNATQPLDPTHDHGLELDDALEFLNTHELEDGQLVDRLTEPSQAADWFLGRGVLHADGGQARTAWTAADLDRIRAVRDALRDVVDAVVEERPASPEALSIVNLALELGPTPHLEVTDAGVRIGHRHGAEPVMDAAAALARPIADELAHGHPERFRTCASDTCRWTFYDGSPSGRRRWCDMKTCGNRAKAARHRARVRAADDASG